MKRIILFVFVLVSAFFSIIQGNELTPEKKQEIIDRINNRLQKNSEIMNRRYYDSKIELNNNESSVSTDTESVGDIVVNDVIDSRVGYTTFSVADMYENILPMDIAEYTGKLITLLRLISNECQEQIYLKDIPDKDMEGVFLQGTPWDLLEEICLYNDLEMSKSRNGKSWLIAPLEDVNTEPKWYFFTENHLEFPSGTSTNGEDVGYLGNSSSNSNSNNTSSNTNSTSNNSSTNTNSNNSTNNTNNTNGSNTNNNQNLLYSVVMDGVKKIIESDIKISRNSTNNEDLEITDEDSAFDNRNDANDSMAIYSPHINAIYIDTTPKKHRKLEIFLKELNVPYAQALINAFFVDKNINPKRVLGMDLASNFKDYQIQSNIDDQIPWGDWNNLVFPEAAPIFSTGLTASLNAYLEETESEIVDFPQVTVRNNETVNLKQVLRVPVIENVSTNSGTNTNSDIATTDGGTATVGTTSSQQNFSGSTQDIGNIIEIRYHEINENYCRLYIKISMETVNNSVSGESITGRIPTSENEINTSVEIPYDHTLMITGLPRMKQVNVDDGVPLLKDIPIVKYLFGKKSVEFQRTSTTIFIQPIRLSRNSKHFFKYDNPVNSKEDSLRTIDSLIQREADANERIEWKEEWEEKNKFKYDRSKK